MPVETIERVSIASLVLDPANVRKHPEANLEAIKGSLAKFGQQKPIVVGKDNVVIAGNGTLHAARALGWTDIAIVRSNLTGAEATAFAIADNRTSELAEWDDEGLSKVLAVLQSDGLLECTGFDEESLQNLLEEVADANQGEIEPDEIPEPLEEAASRPGDVWILGDHRLMCGDSSKREDIIKLLAGATIQLVNTDPPYNVKVEPRSNNAIAAGLSSFAKQTHHQKLDVERHPEKSKPTTKKLRPKDRPLANDFLSDEAFEKILDLWFGNLAFAMDPGAAFYIWGGYANTANYPPALKKNGLYFSQSIIWNKLHPVLTRKDYMGAHEWAFYGWKEGAGHNFYGPNNETDLWEVKKVNPQAMVHLTEKPVELAVRAINNSSKRGENVLDIFGGSGSTIMGCEHTGRRGFSMEMDPSYCDVIVKRWEKTTGKTAILESTGRPFTEVTADRIK